MRQSIKTISGRACLFAVSVVISMFVATISQAAAHPDQEILDRIKPVGEVCIRGEACGEEEAADSSSASAAAQSAEVAAAAGRSAEQIYNASCFACHGAGIAGAPVLGDKDAWAERAAKGLDTVVNNAINGINAMPARGTCMDCSDEEIRATVQYMVDNSQ